MTVPFIPHTTLVTGGAGFIGCNFIRAFLRSEQGLVVNLDALTYAGDLRNCEDFRSERYQFVNGNICDRSLLRSLFSRYDFDCVVHFAAESHVDRSIDAPDDFVKTNVDGTVSLLTAAQWAWKERKDVRFHHVSTDEVFGSLGPEGLFSESTPYDPSSPYSATKAASDHLVRAWHRTYGLPITISNCSNNYGPYQYPEKLIPLIIRNAITHKPLPVYGDGKNIRDWLYVEDHVSAILHIIKNGLTGRTYNVGGNNECTNIQIVHMICHVLDDLCPISGVKSYSQLISFVTDRPGHDRRYAIDASRIRAELNWSPKENLSTGMTRTIRWYLDNQIWMEAMAAKGAQRR